MRHDDDFDYTKQAADHLRETGERLGLCIRSGHAHMFVAAALGYGSRKAMQDDPNGPWFGSQWLGREAENVSKIEEAIKRMNKAPVREDQAPMVAEIVRAGLTPACRDCGEHSSQSWPLGYVEAGDNADWVCPRCSSDDAQYGHCRCCGDDVLYLLDELDDQGLCSEHRGEFDLSPEEEEDWDSYIENIQKDG
jgi:hypothetical protein